MRPGSTISPPSMKARLMQGAGGVAESFRHRDPFDMPGAGRALEIA